MNEKPSVSHIPSAVNNAVVFMFLQNPLSLTVRKSTRCAELSDATSNSMTNQRQQPTQILKNMNKLTNITLVLTVVLTACSGGGADYGRTITEHLMAKAPAGYNVEIESVEELAPVTVADSIAIRQAGFENDRRGDIEHFQGVMELARMLPEGADRQRREAQIQRRIDSLENLAVPVFYDDVPADKVLAVPVRCRYVISAVGTSETITETFDFWLTPDGGKVLHQRKAK